MDNQTQSHQDNEQQRPFESDAKKLANRHLADPNHVITDEDMQNIRVGMSPGPDEPTQEAIEHADEKIADKKTINEDDTTPGSQKMTPWDVVE